MSHKSKKCLKVQAKERFNSFFCLGESKYDVKRSAEQEYKDRHIQDMTVQEYVNQKLRDKIFSWDTYRTYAKHNNYFLDWCEETYHCKTLGQCRSHVDEWLQSRIDQRLSSSTIKMEAAALGKLYQEPTTNFLKTPSRERWSITRSRYDAERDKDFSTSRNADFIEFCRSTGLRRSEVERLKGSQLIERGESYFIGVKGKGGRYREAPIIGDHVGDIVDRMKSAGDGLVWPRVPSHADIHSYRAEYAGKIYKAHERDLSSLPRSELYFCRVDMRGTVYDRKAMEIASEALGHTRIDVIAGHYLWTLVV